MPLNTLASTPLGVMDPVERLRGIGIFGGLCDDNLRQLVESLSLVRADAGEVLFREGDPGREFYVLLDGEMEVLKSSKKAGEARVAVLGPGDWFGEMSVLDILPRSATVRAIAPSHMLKIGAQDLDLLYRRDLKAYSLVVLNIAREMSRRLRVADGILAELVVSLTDYTHPRRA